MQSGAMRLASLPPLPHANDLAAPSTSDPRESLGLVRLLKFLLEADDPDALAARAAAALGLLPEIAWAELDGTAPGDLAVGLGGPDESSGRTQTLAVGLADPNDGRARAFVGGVLELVMGVHARDCAMRRLEADAATDPLTRLWNRRGFDPMLDSAIARAARTGEDIALVLVDVDHFKAINDTFGHAAGDQALVALADAVRSVIRPSDVAARLGGDELAILLSGADAAGAVRMCERLQAVIARVNPLAPRALTVSIGVADLTALGRGIAPTAAKRGLYQAADEALYAAKSAGRACAVCHPATVGAAIEVVDDPTMPIDVAAGF